MIWMLLALAAAVLVFLEYHWSYYALRSLHFKGEADRIMAEPGEAIVWRSTVENHSRLPIPFVRLSEDFPDHATLISSGTWARQTYSRMSTQWIVEQKLSMRPRQKFSLELTLSFPKRGLYQFARSNLSTGDLLGFREAMRNGDWQDMVIIPERSKDAVSIDALGGFLGDISVRRFILEDPILTLGFRDYTGREPMKAISWVRSAAAGTLQVKQYDHTAEHHIMVILNTEGASPEELEACLSLTRSVCEKLELKKMPYSFRTNGNLPGPVGRIFDLAEGLGHRHLRTILYGLGCADRMCFHSFRYLTHRTLQHRKSNESYIVITPPLRGVSAACLRELESAVGNSLCVLTGRGEAKPS